MSWLSEPLLVLDCESTGTDPLTARPLSICLAESDGPGHWEPLTLYLDPTGIEIPEQSIAMHGLTAEKLVGLGVGDRGEAISGVLSDLRDAADAGTPLVGHGLRYDLTLLNSEAHRLGVGTMPAGLICLDTLVLFRRLDWRTGGRSLSKLAERHGIVFPAHDAEADALACLRLLHIIAAENELLPHVDPRTLHALQERWYPMQQEQAEARALGSGVTYLPAPGWPIAVEAVA